MNSQIFQLVLASLTLIDVYSWILSVIGATLTSFLPEKDENQQEIKINSINHLIAIIGGTLFARFGTLVVMKWFDFVLNNPPIGFLVLALLGNGAVQFIIKLGRKIGSDKSVDFIYNLIKNIINTKFKK